MPSQADWAAVDPQPRGSAGLTALLAAYRGQSGGAGRAALLTAPRAQALQLHDQEFVIGGFTGREGPAPGSGHYCWATTTPITLVYAGKVGTGFSRHTLDRLHVILAGLEQGLALFRPRYLPRSGGAGSSHAWSPRWAFSEWTTDGQLRHPRFQGLRDDKDPAVIRETSWRLGQGKVSPALRFTMTVTNTLSSGSASLSRVAPATGFRAESGSSTMSPISGIVASLLLERGRNLLQCGGQHPDS